MDFSIQTSPLLSWRDDHHSLFAGQTRLSASQLGILARKLHHHGAFVRCSAARHAEEFVDGKQGSKNATLEAADNVDTGSWLEGNADLFSGWLSSGSQQAKASNAAGWMTIGGVVMLTIGFALGARSFYLKRDVGRQFTVGPPATEESALSLSKKRDLEDTLQSADTNENVEVSERSDLEKSKQQHGEKDVLEAQVEDGKSRMGLSVQNTGPKSKIEEVQVEDSETQARDSGPITGPETQIIEESINDDPASVSMSDNVGDTDQLANQKPPEHTLVVDASAATEERLSPDSAQGADVNDKNDTPFTYANGDDLNAVPTESKVSDRFLSEESTLDEATLPSDDSYEGLEKRASVFEDDESLYRGGDYATAGSSKDFAPAKVREGFIPATITAPSTSLESSASSPGGIVVPAHVNHMQEQILASLQALKVIEADVKAGDICTRREYARWLMSASALLTRSAAYKVLPAMYIENVSVLAYEDVNPKDQDFPFIQGLAEAGLLSSKLLEGDNHDNAKQDSACIFLPDRHLTRQDLVTWKIALERKPAIMEGVPTETELLALKDILGFVDLDKIHKDALPALLVDISAGEQSIVALAFGHTRRLQPQKPVTKGQAAVALATGEAWEFVSEELARLEAESVAEAAVVAELALEAKAQEQVAGAFEKLLQTEKDKQNASASIVESLRAEIEQMKAAHENEKFTILKDRASLEAERDLLSRARVEVEQQASALSSVKIETVLRHEKMEKLFREAEEERSLISNVRSELEIEKNALILARSWAEEEARKAQKHFKALEQERKRWEGQGIQADASKDLDANSEKTKSFSPSSQYAEETPVSELDNTDIEQPQAENSLTDRLLDKSKETGHMIMDAFIRFVDFIRLMLHTILQRVIDLYGRARGKFHEARVTSGENASKTVEDLKRTVPSSVAGFSSSVKDGTLKMVDDWKEGAEKISQKFKTS